MSVHVHPLVEDADNLDAVAVGAEMITWALTVCLR